MVRIGWLALGLLVSTSAVAGPSTLTWQGRVMDGLGQPVDGSVTLQVDLFDQASGGISDWDDSFDVNASGGFFSIELGSQDALPTDLFSGGDVWIEVSTDAGLLGGRQKLASVPYSMVANGVAVDQATPGDMSCDVAGALTYDTAAAGMRVCDGTSWQWISGNQCDGGATGNTRYSGGELQVCNGTTWGPVTSDAGDMVFHDFEYDSTNRTFGTGWAVGRTWSTHTVPGDTFLSVQVHVPQRNDNANWGGCYTEFQVSLNGGAWSTLGDSGYEAMDNSGAAIQSSHFSFLYDPQQTSEYTVAFRQRHRSYASTCLINQSHGISITGVGLGWTNITLLAYKK